MKLFNENAPWYKGNLHTHTTVSDGFLSVDDCIAAYKAGGYDFLSITDHRKYFPGRTEEDFIVLPGEEFMFEDFEKWTAYHIIGIGLSSHFETDPSTPPQYVIDNIRQREGLVVMGHPFWSLMSHQEICELNGLDATEAFSGISEAYSGRGNSTAYGDVLATMGYPLLLLGVDDMHFHARDFMQAFIMLQTEEFTQEGIMRSLRGGRFYASEGPQIKQIDITGDTVTVDTSELKSLFFLSNTWYNANRVVVSGDGAPLTHAQYTIVPQDRWLRIEGTDSNGKKFTTNYLPVNR